MADLDVNDLPEEMLVHLRGVATHTIELFNLLLPEIDKPTIARLAASTINGIFSQLDPSRRWNLTVRVRDEV